MDGIDTDYVLAIADKYGFSTKWVKKLHTNIRLSPNDYAVSYFFQNKAICKRLERLCLIMHSPKISALINLTQSGASELFMLSGPYMAAVVSNLLTVALNDMWPFTNLKSGSIAWKAGGICLCQNRGIQLWNALNSI